MKRNPAVSVLMLTADHHASFIGKSVESVKNQTFQDWELIILDDGPKYEVEAVVKPCFEPRVRYYMQKHKGPAFIGDSYNQMLSYASGEYIAILEGDDKWPLEKLELQLKIMNDNTEFVLSHGIAQVIDAQDNNILRFPVADLYKHSNWLFNNPIGSAANGFLLYGIFITPATVIIRRKSIDKIGGFRQIENLYTTDGPTFFDLMFEGKFYFIPEVLGYLRWHANSVSKLKDYNIRFVSEMYFINGVFNHQLSVDIFMQKTAFNYLHSILMHSYFFSGCCFLRKGKFNKAKQYFNKLLVSGNIKEKLKGVFGIVCSIMMIRSWCDKIYFFLRRSAAVDVSTEPVNLELATQFESYLNKLK